MIDYISKEQQCCTWNVPDPQTEKATDHQTLTTETNFGPKRDWQLKFLWLSAYILFFQELNLKEYAFSVSTFQAALEPKINYWASMSLF